MIKAKRRSKSQFHSNYDQFRIHLLIGKDHISVSETLLRQPSDQL
ncbi:hypothetical protein Sgly_2169 [Syntrophobotulus glycolicus DSM 8271]|uniref:Uncharacterized protein n=1 Tax=Syntrophobotulus glycolicus (strain DSM 8271 / FlGlyR) TaxID=645991 RepID=F0T2Q9_SYNGF|nr:hypothetical protein Sgly_2169 [Syntrophobotulus glycolicus DSM 8271]